MSCWGKGVRVARRVLQSGGGCFGLGGVFTVNEWRLEGSKDGMCGLRKKRTKEGD